MMPVIGIGAVSGIQPAAAATSPDSLGTDFWLAFEGNLSAPELTLFIAGPTATTGTVDAPGAAFSAPFTVTPGTVTSVSVPTSLAIDSSDLVESLGIHVTAGAEVTVYGLNRVPATTDAFLGLPTDILGTEYVTQGYKNTDIIEGTQFAVLATQNATTVTINPTVTTNGHTAGTPYTVTLDQGQTYQLRNTDPAPADLSGSIVTANKPVAVFAGHECGNIPAGAFACDHLVEEMTPTTTWGKDFVTEPLATRTGGDTFRFLADTDNTTVKVNGVAVATLNRGQLFEQLVGAGSVITSDQPILVTQYSNGTTFDNVTSDPFEVIVPPAEQFLNSYTVTTPASGFDTNFINVVAPTASIGTVTLDSVAVPAASFTPIPGSTFSGAQLAVALGSHTLGGARPFGVTVYGFATADSYGYPGGLSLAPVATVTSLSLAPKTATAAVNTQHCVTATVLDQTSQPVVGVRVDFTVTGSNPTSGFGNTAADGAAQFCYTGTNAGSDAIQAAVGTTTDSAAVQWTGAVVNRTLTVTRAGTGVGTVTSAPPGIDCGTSCTATFATGASVALTAAAADGSTFTGWSGACTGTGPCTVTMDADQAVTATFDTVSTPTSLTITGESQPSAVTEGGSALALFTVTDVGPGDATNASVHVTLPAGTTPFSVTSGQGTCAPVVANETTCALGTLAEGASTTVRAVFTLSAANPPGGTATTTATASSDQTAPATVTATTTPVIIAATPGSISGFVPPGGTLATGVVATPEDNTIVSFTLPNTGVGTPITLSASDNDADAATFCAGLPCSGKIIFVSPFVGYNDPLNPPHVRITWDASVFGNGLASTLYVLKEGMTAAVVVPECGVTPKPPHDHHHDDDHHGHDGKGKDDDHKGKGKGKDDHKGKGKKDDGHHDEHPGHPAPGVIVEGPQTGIAIPSPCVDVRSVDANGDLTFDVLLLSGDPRFGRR